MRVSGQDTERGTFNQRHAVQYDQCTEERFCGVEQLAEHSDGHFEIHNSTLSEAAALGYEYGAYPCKWCVCVEGAAALALWWRPTTANLCEPQQATRLRCATH